MNAEYALRAFDLPRVATLAAAENGLINQTWLVGGPTGPIGVLQRLNTAIFVPEVHEDIEAVTAWLDSHGVVTPRLVRTVEGRLWHTAADGSVWRVLTYLGNRTIHRLHHAGDADTAGALVGRFHAALHGFEHTFRSVRPGAHDTAGHMTRLVDALEAHRGHRLYDRVAPVAQDILGGWQSWNGRLGGLPRRVIHGDLKISNVRFDDAVAVALVDLDTLAWGTLDVELGDAMRSWCNTADESGPGRFEPALFAAAMQGYARGCAAHPPSHAEWSSIAGGLERICWELASRFAQDALAESYFGWDPAFGSRGEHNLARARGQAQLAASVRAARPRADAVLAGLRPGRSPGARG